MTNDPLLHVPRCVYQKIRPPLSENALFWHVFVSAGGRRCVPSDPTKSCVRELKEPRQRETHINHGLERADGATTHLF
jgi:hypothetical protein